MNLFPEHITINGLQITIKDLLENYSYQEDWEKDWLDFLQEWYAAPEYIGVKTSGSTGKPKSIQLQKSFVAESAIRTIKYFGLKHRDKILHCLPSKYIAGKLMIVRALIGDLDLHLVNPSTDFSFLEEEHFEFAAMVPNQVEKIVKIRDWKIKQLLIGGAAISSSLEEKLQSKKTVCYSSYGMTETATHIALREINGKNKSLYYKCLDEIKVDIDENSCLQIHITDAEKQVIQTNDLAELIDEKTFKILGRSDNVIISGGAKYSPESIEKKLEPFIKETFLISSKPHKKLGQQIVLFLEGKEDSDMLVKIQNTCETKLDNFEQPRKIMFVQKFPRSKNGKIIRGKIL